ncbi:MAG: tetratricopeptide repeat protein [Brumimicrobium sp.]|nr:tetratricopeptide repeat protein [Brumimicrobium sp.]
MLKTKILFLLSGIIALLVVGCNNESTVKNEQFFEKEESLSEAELLLQIEDSLKKHPDNIALWLRKGEICRKNLDFKCALDAGARAFVLDSTNIEARKLYAWTLINKPNPPLEDIERAKRHYKYVLSVTPNDPGAMVELANTYSLTGDFKTAMKFINDALRIDDKYRDAYVLKGSIYRNVENYDLALSSYQTAVQIDPDFFIGHLQIGWLLTEMGNHELALEYYENASELNPENLNALYGIAKSLQDMEKYDEALQNYRRLLHVDSTAVVAYFNQAYIKQYHQAELDSAVYFYNELLDRDPQYIHAWYQLGETYFSQGRKADAARAFAEALRIDRDYEPAREASQKLR